MYGGQNPLPGAEGLLGTLQQDPGGFANMLNQLTQNPNI
jgi:hypothetical protein